MGTLALESDQDSAAAKLVAGSAAPAVVGAELSAVGSDAGGDVVQEKKDEWTPSGGKKLTTEVSIVLENVTAGMKKPCVLDLKLGARLWDDDAPEAKRRKLDEVMESSTSGSLGYRIAGMKVWKGDAVAVNEKAKDEDGYAIYDKFYGRNMKTEDIKSGFETFLAAAKPERRREILERFTRDARGIQLVLENEESRMYSASILMVYEGDHEALEAALTLEDQADAKEALDEVEEEEEEGDDDDEPKPKVCDVRLIDFAHARWTPGEGPDENVLRGVKNVYKVLKDLGADMQGIAEDEKKSE